MTAAAMMNERVDNLLSRLYAPETASCVAQDLRAIVAKYKAKIHSPPVVGLSERDAIPIRCLNRASQRSNRCGSSAIST
jgi:hypothetical protein